MAEIDSGASAEMPRWQCHKQVWALKIKQRHEADAPTDAAWEILVPDDERYSPFAVSRAYSEKHNPEPGGYFVVYEDGYQSYSPAKAFEQGYTKL